MITLPEPITQLIDTFRQIAGVGPRSAERMALDLVQSSPEKALNLSDAIRRARERTSMCSICGGLTEIEPCALCTDDARDSSLLCVVEHPVDILRIEKSGAYRGRYHALGGKLAPLEGIGPDELRIMQLEQRLQEGRVQEVILALGTDVEGDATSHYLAKRLKASGLAISRIAHGLPAGAGLDLADELTLSHALEGRRRLLP